MEPPSSPRVSVLNPLGTDVSLEPIASAVGHALRSHGHHGETSVLLTHDEDIRRLNREFRHLDEPTDVLTFPSGEEDPLGDIAIALPYASRQAEKRGVPLEQELAYLAIHGALHLAGFDDETEPERARMVREMNRIATELGLPPDEEWGSLLHEEPV